LNNPLSLYLILCYLAHMSEIVFEITQDDTEGGFIASALGHSIVTQADTWEELRANVREAVLWHFDEGEAPGVIRLRRVLDELIDLNKTESFAPPNEILQEVWAARKALSESCRHDIHRLFAEARERQRKSGRLVVNLEKPRPAKTQ
jgi:predicted RNase H-like HicB family nuclease